MSAQTIAIRWEETLIPDRENPQFAPGSLLAILSIAERLDDARFLFLASEQLNDSEEALLDTLKSQGVNCDCRSLDEALKKENAVVFDGFISSRESDVRAALSLGNSSVVFLDTDGSSSFDESFDGKTVASWQNAAATLLLPDRKAEIKRKTKETDIELRINLDGSGQSSVKTGLSFFDHMLDQLARHGGIDLEVSMQGDLQVDEHHTIEDLAIVLGEAFDQALGEKRGIERYGFLLPMDDCLAQVAIDFSGRSWLVWEAEFNREKVGDMPTEMFMHFFKSFSDAARCNLNVKVEGENEHHKIESIFKAWAKAIKMAVRRDADNMALPSTKGLL